MFGLRRKLLLPHCVVLKRCSPCRACSFFSVTPSGPDLLRGGLVRADGRPRHVTCVTPTGAVGVVPQQTGMLRYGAWCGAVARNHRLPPGLSVIDRRFFQVHSAAVVPCVLCFSTFVIVFLYRGGVSIKRYICFAESLLSVAHPRLRNHCVCALTA